MPVTNQYAKNSCKLKKNKEGEENILESYSYKNCDIVIRVNQ